MAQQPSTVVSIQDAFKTDTVKGTLLLKQYLQQIQPVNEVQGLVKWSPESFYSFVTEYGKQGVPMDMETISGFNLLQHMIDTAHVNNPTGSIQALLGDLLSDRLVHTSINYLPGLLIYNEANGNKSIHRQLLDYISQHRPQFLQPILNFVIINYLRLARHDFATMWLCRSIYEYQLAPSQSVLKQFTLEWAKGSDLESYWRTFRDASTGIAEPTPLGMVTEMDEFLLAPIGRLTPLVTPKYLKSLPATLEGTDLLCVLPLITSGPKINQILFDDNVPDYAKVLACNPQQIFLSHSDLDTTISLITKANRYLFYVPKANGFVHKVLMDLFKSKHFESANRLLAACLKRGILVDAKAIVHTLTSLNINWSSFVETMTTHGSFFMTHPTEHHLLRAFIYAHQGDYAKARELYISQLGTVKGSLLKPIVGAMVWAKYTPVQEQNLASLEKFIGIDFQQEKKLGLSVAQSYAGALYVLDRMGALGSMAAEYLSALKANPTSNRIYITTETISLLVSKCRSTKSQSAALKLFLKQPKLQLSREVYSKLLTESSKDADLAATLAKFKPLWRQKALSESSVAFLDNYISTIESSTTKGSVQQQQEKVRKDVQPTQQLQRQQQDKKNTEDDVLKVLGRLKEIIRTPVQDYLINECLIKVENEVENGVHRTTTLTAMMNMFLQYFTRKRQAEQFMNHLDKFLNRGIQIDKRTLELISSDYSTNGGGNGVATKQILALGRLEIVQVLLENASSLRLNDLLGQIFRNNDLVVKYVPGLIVYNELRGGSLLLGHLQTHLTQCGSRTIEWTLYHVIRTYLELGHDHLATEWFCRSVHHLRLVPAGGPLISAFLHHYRTPGNERPLKFWSRFEARGIALTVPPSDKRIKGFLAEVNAKYKAGRQTSHTSLPDNIDSIVTYIDSIPLDSLLHSSKKNHADLSHYAKVLVLSPEAFSKDMTARGNLNESLELFLANEPYTFHYSYSSIFVGSLINNLIRCGHIDLANRLLIACFEQNRPLNLALLAQEATIYNAQPIIDTITKYGGRYPRLDGLVAAFKGNLAVSKKMMQTESRVITRSIIGSLVWASNTPANKQTLVDLEGYLKLDQAKDSNTLSKAYTVAFSTLDRVGQLGSLPIEYLARFALQSDGGVNAQGKYRHLCTSEMVALLLRKSKVPGMSDTFKILFRQNQITSDKLPLDIYTSLQTECTNDAELADMFQKFSAIAPAPLLPLTTIVKVVPTRWCNLPESLDPFDLFHSIFNYTIVKMIADDTSKKHERLKPIQRVSVDEIYRYLGLILVSCILESQFRRFIQVGTFLTIDESRIKAKPNDKDKPEKWALEHNTIADTQTGYLVSLMDIKEETSGFVAFRKLVERAPLVDGRVHHFTADNKFSNFDNLDWLLEKGHLGTVCIKSVTKPSTVWKVGIRRGLEKNLSRFARRTENGQKRWLTACCYYNNAVIQIATTAFIVRKSKKRVLDAARKTVLDQYDNTKRAVDHFNQLYYSYSHTNPHSSIIQSKVIAWFGFALTNSYIIYTEKVKEPLKHKQFLMAVADRLTCYQGDNDGSKSNNNKNK
eukprot:gene7427-8688_t